MSSTSPLLVIGANGKVGSRVAALLTAAGSPVRAVSRRTSPPFDWVDRSTWAQVLRGVERAFVSYVPDLAVEGAPEAIQDFATMAHAAGVKHLVLLSGRGEAKALRCERIVAASGIGFTIVRASWFNQNFSEGALLPYVLGGVLALPAGQRREPFIDVEDVAEVAAAALLDPKHAGKTYEVTGPRLLSFADAAGQIATAAGVALEYVPVSAEEFHAALVPAVGADMAKLFAEIFAELFDGRNESTADGVEHALGRPPRDFSQFVQDAAARGVWSARAAAE